MDWKGGICMMVMMVAGFRAYADSDVEKLTDIRDGRCTGVVRLPDGKWRMGRFWVGNTKRSI